MSTVGQIERKTQDRVVRLFTDELDYEYLGNWHDGNRTGGIETDLLAQNLRAAEARWSRLDPLVAALERTPRQAVRCPQAHGPLSPLDESEKYELPRNAEMADRVSLQCNPPICRGWDGIWAPTPYSHHAVIRFPEGIRQPPTRRI